MGASRRIRRPLRRGALGAFALLSASACADPGRDPDAGVVGERWTTRPDLRIGSLDDSVYALTRPTALLVADDGTIYTAHGQEQRVRVWAPDGTAAGDVGGPGEGPGEFQRVASMGFHGDTLWVFDDRQYRTTYFDRVGGLLGMESPHMELGEPDGLPPPRPERPLRDGTYLAEPMAFSHLIASGELDSGAWLHTTSDGDVLDTVFVQSFGSNGEMALEREAGGVYSRQPFADDQLVAHAPDGGLVVVSRRASAEEPAWGSVEVVRVGVDGDTAWVREMRFDPEPVTEAQADSAAEALAGQLHEFLGEGWGWSLRRFEREVGEALYRPPHHPAINEARVGRDGTVWLRLGRVAGGIGGLGGGGLAGASGSGSGEAVGVDGAGQGTGEGSGDAMRTWLVLGPDGSDLATVALPEELNVLEVDRGHVWGFETDELDVPYLVRWVVGG